MSVDPYPIIAMPFCLVLGVDTSVTMAVARLTLPLARPPKNLARTNVANVEAKHLRDKVVFNWAAAVACSLHIQYITKS